MGKFKPAKNLDAKVAAHIRPQVDDLAKEVERRAKDGAPGVKEWVTVGDAKVRHTHRATNGQQRPENLRFELPSTKWDMGEGRSASRGGVNIVGPTTYFLKPRHPENESIAVVNHVNCRCHAVVDPEGLSRHMVRVPAVAEGAKVKAAVRLRAPGAIQAELGDTYYLGSNMGMRTEEGTHFMENAARDTARSRTST